MNTIMPARIATIDILRGLVIILMALDHTRDFMTGSDLNPRNIHEPLLFMTRWITHICAPTFIFLAGMSAYLFEQQKTKRATFSFLAQRGLLLIILEFTVVHFGWTFSITTDFMMAQVIWAIGLSLLILSILIFLPIKIIAGFSIIIILTHNTLDLIQAKTFGSLEWLWLVLHQAGFFTPWTGVKLLIAYPIIPWFAVMALGYSTAPLIIKALKQHTRYLVYTGLMLITAFIVLRYFNGYGNPKPWQVEDTVSATIFSFINCEKYPPSLLYLLITLGISSLLLAGFNYFEKPLGVIAKILQIFGKTSLFFYLIHLPVIHLTALILTYINGFDTAWLFIEPFFSKPSGYGYPLGITYLLWLVIISALYPLCYYYSEYKKRHKDMVWLSYF